MSCPEFKPCSLYRLVIDDVSLSDALLKAGGRISSGLFYGPQLRIARILTGGDGITLEWDDPTVEHTTLTPAQTAGTTFGSVYEARCFSDEIELIWWRNPTSHHAGRASFVWENEDAEAPNGSAEHPSRLPCLHKQLNAYLLWGEPDQGDNAGPRPHWERLESPRIGALSLPTTAKSPGRRWLHTLEYFGVAQNSAGGMGNVGLVHERLIGWSDKKLEIPENRGG